MRPELQRLLPLGVAACKGRDFTAPRAEVLQSQVPQPANADDRHAIRRLHVELHDRIENRDATAEERTGLAGIERFRQRADPGPLGPDAGGKSTGPPHDRSLRREAKILVSRKTLPARAATRGIPTEPDPIPDL